MILTNVCVLVCYIDQKLGYRPRQFAIHQATLAID